MKYRIKAYDPLRLLLLSIYRQYRENELNDITGLQSAEARLWDTYENRWWTDLADVYWPHLGGLWKAGSTALGSPWTEAKNKQSHLSFPVQLTSGRIYLLCDPRQHLSLWYLIDSPVRRILLWIQREISGKASFSNTFIHFLIIKAI